MTSKATCFVMHGRTRATLATNGEFAHRVSFDLGPFDDGAVVDDFERQPS
jgi:hypothetical protein